MLKQQRQTATQHPNKPTGNVHDATGMLYRGYSINIMPDGEAMVTRKTLDGQTFMAKLGDFVLGGEMQIKGGEFSMYMPPEDVDEVTLAAHKRGIRAA